MEPLASPAGSSVSLQKDGQRPGERGESKIAPILLTPSLVCEGLMNQVLENRVVLSLCLG